MGAPWLRNTRRPGRTQGARILTNNPERGSNRFGGLRPVTFARRGIRTLVKRDPNNAQGTPAKDVLLNTPGMSGNGASRGVKTMGHTESRRTQQGTTQSGTGATKVIRDRSKRSNIRGLKKR
jgi:hypothetical protein